MAWSLPNFEGSTAEQQLQAMWAMDSCTPEELSSECGNASYVKTFFAYKWGRSRGTGGKHQGHRSWPLLWAEFVISSRGPRGSDHQRAILLMKHQSILPSQVLDSTHRKSDFSDIRRFDGFDFLDQSVYCTMTLPARSKSSHWHVQITNNNSLSLSNQVNELTHTNIDLFASGKMLRMLARAWQASTRS